jgi:hypothetical protein
MPAMRTPADSAQAGRRPDSRKDDAIGVGATRVHLGRPPRSRLTESRNRDALTASSRRNLLVAEKLGPVMRCSATAVRRVAAPRKRRRFNPPSVPSTMPVSVPRRSAGAAIQGRPTHRAVSGGSSSFSLAAIARTLVDEPAVILGQCALIGCSQRKRTFGLRVHEVSAGVAYGGRRGPSGNARARRGP